MASGLGLEETELRLGLPGGGGGGGGGDGEPTGRNFGKRGFAQTIDLKLQLQTASAAADTRETAAASEGAAAAEKLKRSPCSHKNVAAACNSADPEKPPAPKYGTGGGWPPVRSFRKNIMAVQSEKGSKEDHHHGQGENKSGGGTTATTAIAAFVKVSMDGAPYLRKVDLKMYKSYRELSIALEKMFSSFTTGNCGSQGIMNGKDFTNESKVMDLLNGSEYVPTYEDKDGDWMLVGDVPWEMFVESCKRLRIMKGSEAIGLAPRAMEKCKNRS
uniref:Auxin-responsive protein n=1 Tax=Ananas comosus var. bracteatus TaxID=296719 RepID=A0A6V7QFS4_ANACO|nr:unnamed protein product [Ananas comosus var. bracteatus]